MNIKQDIHSIDGYQKMFSKLENPDVVFQNYVKKIARYQFQIKAIIQVSCCNFLYFRP